MISGDKWRLLNNKNRQLVNKKVDQCLFDEFPEMDFLSFWMLTTILSLVSVPETIMSPWLPLGFGAALAFIFWPGKNISIKDFYLA